MKLFEHEKNLSGIRELLNSFLSSVYSDRNILKVAIPLAISFAGIFLLTKIGILTVSTYLYDNLYFSNTILCFLIIAAVVVGYLTGMGAFLVVKHSLFVWHLSRFPLKPDAIQMKHVRVTSKRLEELHELSEILILRFSDLVCWCGDWNPGTCFH